MIPNSFIFELIDRVDLVSLIDESVPLKKGGKDFIACCPFHHEKTPSFTVVPSKKFYHCFGCGAHGNALDFMMEYHHLGFVDAVKALASRARMTVPQVEREDPREVAFRQKQKQSLQSVLIDCARFYESRLKDNVQAQQYLIQRGVTQATIDKFGLGYAPDQWRSLSHVFDVYPNDLLIESGMVVEKESQHYDRFRDRIMFPIRDSKGAVIAFGGRILEKGEPKYLNSPETPLFNKRQHLYGLFEARHAIRTYSRVLVVEGYMDVAMLSQHGVEYAVATLGTATGEDHIRTLFQQSDAIYFCFDGDAAGRRAAWRALENALTLLKDGKSLYFLFLPIEHDPDSYVREYGKERFEFLLQNDSLPLSEYWLNTLSNQFDLKTNEGCAQLVKAAGGYLQKMPQSAFKLLMIKNIAQLSGLDVSDIQAMLGESVPTKSRSYRKAQLPSYSLRQPKMLSLAEKQIKSLLINPQWAPYVRLPEYLELSDSCAALQELADCIMQQDAEIDSSKLSFILKELQHENLFRTLLAHSDQMSESWDTPSDEEMQSFCSGMKKLEAQLRMQQVGELRKEVQNRPLTQTETDLLRTLLKQGGILNESGGS